MRSFHSSAPGPGNRCPPRTLRLPRSQVRSTQPPETVGAAAAVGAPGAGVDEDGSRRCRGPARRPDAVRFRQRRGDPRHRAGSRGGFGRASPTWSARWRPATARCSTAGRAAVADRCMAPQNRGRPIDPEAYQEFLARSATCSRSRPDFVIGTQNVDPEIARIAGPQLVVPVTNARYALNAANARWGSLYDALYGTDAIPEDGGAPRGGGYNRLPRRPGGGASVREFLDEAAPLDAGRHADATGYRIEAGKLSCSESKHAAPRWPTRRSSSVIVACRPRPPPCCYATTTCTSSC